MEYLPNSTGLDFLMYFRGTQSTEPSFHSKSSFQMKISNIYQCRIFSSTIATSEIVSLFYIVISVALFML